MSEIIYEGTIRIDYMELLTNYDSKNKGYILKYENQETKIGTKGFEEKLLSLFEKIGEVKNVGDKNYKIIIKNKILKLRHLYDKRKKTHTLEIRDEDNNLMLLTGEKLIEKILPLFKKFEVLNKDINEADKANTRVDYSVDSTQKNTEDMHLNNSYIHSLNNIKLDSENIGDKIIIAGTLSLFMGLVLLDENVIKKVKIDSKILGFLFLIVVIVAYILWTHKKENNGKNQNNSNTKISKTPQYQHAIYDLYSYHW